MRPGVLCYIGCSHAEIGLGNSGVHLPHGMSYPVSVMIQDDRAVGYPTKRPLILHGMSVVMNAPAVLCFAAESNPRCHLRAAVLM